MKRNNERIGDKIIMYLFYVLVIIICIFTLVSTYKCIKNKIENYLFDKQIEKQQKENEILEESSINYESIYQNIEETEFMEE